MTEDENSYTGYYLLWSECLCPPKLMCWNPYLQGGDGIGRWGLREVIRSGGWRPHEGD